MADKAITVLIAIDASKKAQYAVDFYFDHLHRSSYSIVFVHVVELPDIAQSRQVYMSPMALAELWKDEQDKAKVLEEKYTAMAKSKGVQDVKMRVDGGMKPGSSIVHAAEEEKCGLIVLGTRGLGQIRRTILGSVSDYVVHHASCPVIICREE